MVFKSLSANPTTWLHHCVGIKINPIHSTEKRELSVEKNKQKFGVRGGEGVPLNKKKRSRKRGGNLDSKAHHLASVSITQGHLFGGKEEEEGNLLTWEGGLTETETYKNGEKGGEGGRHLIWKDSFNRKSPDMGG